LADLLGQFQRLQGIDEDGRDFWARIDVADRAAHLQQAARLVFAPVLRPGCSFRVAVGLVACCRGWIAGRQWRCRKRLPVRGNRRGRGALRAIAWRRAVLWLVSAPTDLQATAVHFHNSQLRGGPIRRGIFALGQGPGQPGRHQGVTLVHSFLTDLLGQALDLLGIDRHLGQDP
jgi:hypothetical protein